MALRGAARIHRLARFGLTTADASALAAFYETALGFRRLAARRLGGAAFERLMDVEGGAQCVRLGLGREIIELLQFDLPGRPYPLNSSASDLDFQHFAIVAADIRLAYERLSATPGWRAISTDGPQRLPAESGGVTAFKFRDPEGHPLELLAFPPRQVPSRWRAPRGSAPCLGIDHSAIGVADTARAANFYERLGLRVASRSLNVGPEQARLDGVPEPLVEVTALSPRRATPHIELLCYRSVVRGERSRLRNNDIVASRLILEEGDPALPSARRAARRAVTDLDGHHLLIVPPQPNPPGA
jgi:catechol 2,3-dioxygenase-like lactoylglutathione lyase family enzyme